jgi:DNA helicase-2/ATP-dependent DNA helicase PcrA
VKTEQNEEEKTSGELPKYLKELNERQRSAVLAIEGPLLILAGAGAGKTKTITHRILHLIKNGVPGRKILAITFTNKSAKEMKERLHKILRSDSELNFPVEIEGSSLPFVSTFHSLGVHILKENSERLGMPRHFTIFDRNDSKGAVKEAMERRGVDPKRFEPSKMLSIISREKGNGVSFNEFLDKSADSHMAVIARSIWEEYEFILKKEKAYDFDDLLLKAYELLKIPEVLETFQNKWSHIHIDEYQDTNRVQYEMAKLLAMRERNIAVVGDIDQSIYSWRGADFKNILRFEKDYPEAKTVLLEENYRSTKTIIEVSNKIIEKNTLRKEKILFTNNEDGDQISLYCGFDEKDEADYVARTSQMLIRQGVNPSQIAILYRANFQSRSLEESFIRKNIPYNLLGTKFFDRKEIKDCLSYLKCALNPDSMSEFKRAISSPARGVGKTTILKILEGKEEELPRGTKEKIDNFRKILAKIKEVALTEKPSETIKKIISLSGLELSFQTGLEEDLERLENIRELVTTASSYDHFLPEEGIEKFLENVSLASDQDDLKEEKEAVRFMTVHASKGLEFDYCFITGLEEDLFPHTGLSDSPKNIEGKEEERRLFYVALTRARKKVYLTYTQMRTIFGSRKSNIPSEFVLDIDDEFIERENGSSNTGREKIVYLEF